MIYLFENSLGFYLFKKSDKIKKVNSYLFKNNEELLETYKSLENNKLPSNLLNLINSVFNNSDDILAVRYTRLVQLINDNCNLNTKFILDDVFREIIQEMESYSNKDIISKILYLSHKNSLEKIKYNTDKLDFMIIQSVNLLLDIDKDINLHCMRIREWYGFHFPELSLIIDDNLMYIKIVSVIKNDINKKLKGNFNNIDNKTDNNNIDNKTDNNNIDNKTDNNNIDTSILDNKLNLNNFDNNNIYNNLLEIAGDLTDKIINLSKNSMGNEISNDDIENIINDCKSIIKNFEYRNKLYLYIKEKMNIIAPNITNLIGDLMGARLISKAGSLSNLSKYPGSTVQLLGAEKSLFQALRNKSNTPKYGIIYESSLLGQVPLEFKGKVARTLASKISLCSKIDSLGNDNLGEFGKECKIKIINRIKNLENRSKPKKKIIKKSKFILNTQTKYDDKKDVKRIKKD